LYQINLNQQQLTIDICMEERRLNWKDPPKCPLHSSSLSRVHK